MMLETNPGDTSASDPMLEKQEAKKRKAKQPGTEGKEPASKQAKTEKKKEKKHSKPKQRPTVSVALPGSIVDNAQSGELRTYLAGQIARALTVYEVDEVVVFDESQSGHTTTEGAVTDAKNTEGTVFLARILQYLETPQYLRKHFFPKHRDLQYAGLLNPLDAPHHLRETMPSRFREGVTLDRPTKNQQGTYVYVGLKKEVLVDKVIQPGVRVTVDLGENAVNVELAFSQDKHLNGVLVSPTTPRNAPTPHNQYWGYTTRMASSLSEVFTGSPFKRGYDLTIGTSERGDNVDEMSNMPDFEHSLIVLGGVHGLEASLEADEQLPLDNPKYLFDTYLNVCPSQGSRTIRTEEALLITMSALRPMLQKKITSNITPTNSS
eukprot:Clim_evm5s219 gene=Clim_evmTU5s219